MIVKSISLIATAESTKALSSRSISALVALGLCSIVHPALAQAPSPPAPTAPEPSPPPSTPTEPAPAEQTPKEPTAAPAEPAPNATLRGTVTSENTHAPQAGASVTVVSTGAQAVTDDQGEYTLSVPPGTHIVRVEVPGYYPVERTVTLNAASEVVDFRMLEDRAGEVITIVGSRTARSRLETPVPVDVIGSDVLTESTRTETNQILNTIAPSFNATHLSITDGTDHIDPADLRGLGPEHVLVLVNGKRLHQSSLINVFTGGTVGIDLNAIPANAIARIEVLRDGAASQYGSDAIAGVINIVLKDTVDLIDLYTMTGITAAGDGVQFKLGGNTGMKLGDRGFVNVTGEFFTRGRTNRAKAWPDDIFVGVVGKEATDVELARRGKTRDDFKLDVGTAGALVGT
jgi:iron complex outermembrane receptor protein